MYRQLTWFISCIIDVSPWLKYWLADYMRYVSVSCIVSPNIPSDVHAYSCKERLFMHALLWRMHWGRFKMSNWHYCLNLVLKLASFESWDCFIKTNKSKRVMILRLLDGRCEILNAYQLKKAHRLKTDCDAIENLYFTRLYVFCKTFFYLNNKKGSKFKFLAGISPQTALCEFRLKMIKRVPKQYSMCAWSWHTIPLRSYTIAASAFHHEEPVFASWRERRNTVERDRKQKPCAWLLFLRPGL